MASEQLAVAGGLSPMTDSLLALKGSVRPPPLDSPPSDPPLPLSGSIDCVMRQDMCVCLIIHTQSTCYGFTSQRHLDEFNQLFYSVLF